MSFCWHVSKSKKKTIEKASHALKNKTLFTSFLKTLVLFFISSWSYFAQGVKKLFYSVETFLRCGNFLCFDFSTVWRDFLVWRLSDFSAVWRKSDHNLQGDMSASYGVWTLVTINEYVKSFVSYPFGQTALETVIN